MQRRAAALARISSALQQRARHRSALFGSHFSSARSSALARLAPCGETRRSAGGVKAAAIEAEMKLLLIGAGVARHGSA